MLFNRVIPVLLLKEDYLVKTLKFKKEIYVGDPVNAVKIFNEKEVDELVILDITASKEGREPNYPLLTEIASECFMPLCYGGGIRTIEHARKLFECGIEKISINTAALNSLEFIEELVAEFGSQSIVVSIDIETSFLGNKSIRGSAKTSAKKLSVLEFAQQASNKGCGEIFLNVVEKDGMKQGYDLKLISDLSDNLDIPVICCGGAGEIAHFKQALDSGASAVAAGAKFVLHGRHHAVLITYLNESEIRLLND